MVCCIHDVFAGCCVKKDVYNLPFVRAEVLFIEPLFIVHCVNGQNQNPIVDTVVRIFSQERQSSQYKISMHAKIISGQYLRFVLLLQ